MARWYLYAHHVVASRSFPPLLRAILPSRLTVIALFALLAFMITTPTIAASKQSREIPAEFIGKWCYTGPTRDEKTLEVLTHSYIRQESFEHDCIPLEIKRFELGQDEGQNPRGHRVPLHL
jgi:hypothetical protein